MQYVKEDLISSVGIKMMEEVFKHNNTAFIIMPVYKESPGIHADKHELSLYIKRVPDGFINQKR